MCLGVGVLEGGSGTSCNLINLNNQVQIDDKQFINWYETKNL